MIDQTPRLVRTRKLAGAVFVETADLPVVIDMYQEGERKNAPTGYSSDRKIGAAEGSTERRGPRKDRVGEPPATGRRQIS